MDRTDLKALNRRFIIRDKGGGFYGVWDITQQAYRLHPGFDFADEPEPAQAEADRLENEVAIAGFEEFMKSGIVYRFKQDQIALFLRGLNGWMKEQGKPKPKTHSGFDGFRGFYLLLQPQEGEEDERADPVPPVRPRRGKGASSR